MTTQSASQSTVLKHWTRWCFETCLLYGCDPATAARVAAYFCDAIREDAHA